MACLKLPITSLSGSAHASNGEITETNWQLHSETEAPTIIKERDPWLIVATTGEIWVLLETQADDFFQKLASGDVHITGNFRECGRLTPRLIDLALSIEVLCAIDQLASATKDKTSIEVDLPQQYPFDMANKGHRHADQRPLAIGLNIEAVTQPVL